MTADPVLNLYESSCRLLATAERLEAAAGVRGAAPAAAPALGCVEAALDTIARAVDALRAQTGAHLEDGRPEEGDEIERRLVVLSATLEFATQAAASARGAVGPAIRRTTAVSMLPAAYVA